MVTKVPSLYPSFLIDTLAIRRTVANGPPLSIDNHGATLPAMPP